MSFPGNSRSRARPHGLFPLASLQMAVGSCTERIPCFPFPVGPFYHPANFFPIKYSQMSSLQAMGPCRGLRPLSSAQHPRPLSAAPLLPPRHQITSHKCLAAWRYASAASVQRQASAGRVRCHATASAAPAAGSNACCGAAAAAAAVSGPAALPEVVIVVVAAATLYTTLCALAVGTQYM